MIWIPAAIAGVTGLISGIVGRRQKKKDARRSLRDTKELADYTYKQDVDMWQRQNQYNMPRNQMQRLRDANLNPNLVYGTGTVTGNTSGQTPKYQQQVADYSKLPTASIDQAMSMLGQFQNFKMSNAQTDKIQSEADMKKMEKDWLALKTLEEEVGPQGKKRLTYNRNINILKNTQLEALRENIQFLKKRQAEKGVDIDLKNVRLEFEKFLKTMGIIGKGAQIYKSIR